MKKINKSKILKSIKKKIPFVFLMLIVGASCFYVGRSIGLNTDTSSSNTKIEDVKVSTQTIKKTLTSSGEIKQSATNKLSLSTSYVFNSVLVEEDEIVKKGTKLVKYSNGKYLVAPYDLIITETNLPSSKKICTSEHYITVSSFNVLSTSFRVDETKINSISLGQTIKIKVSSLDDKEFTGYITNISSTANNGKFTVTAEFDNDGNVKLGMTVNIIV